MQASQNPFERSGEAEFTAEAGRVESWIEAVRGEPGSCDSAGELEGEHDVEQLALRIERH